MIARKLTEPGDKHFTVSAYIVSDEREPRILLAFHKKLGKWMQPGGHIERDENPVEALIREVREETGLEVRASLPKATDMGDGVRGLALPEFLQQQPIPAHGTEPAHFHIDHGYVLQVAPSKLRPGEHESQQIGWFTKAELAAIDMFPNVRLLAEKLLT